MVLFNELRRLALLLNLDWLCLNCGSASFEVEQLEGGYIIKHEVLSQFVGTLAHFSISGSLAIYCCCLLIFSRLHFFLKKKGGIYEQHNYYTPALVATSSCLPPAG